MNCPGEVKRTYIQKQRGKNLKTYAMQIYSSLKGISKFNTKSYSHMAKYTDESMLLDTEHG